MSSLDSLASRGVSFFVDMLIDGGDVDVDLSRVSITLCCFILFAVAAGGSCRVLGDWARQAVGGGTGTLVERATSEFSSHFASITSSVDEEGGAELNWTCD